MWKAARVLARHVYAETAAPTFSTDRAMSSQMRRAAVSVMANIAEGYERSASKAEFARFLSIAKGSCGELRCHLYVALDQHYLDRDQLKRLGADCLHVSRMLHALIQSVRAPRAPTPGS